MVDLDYTMFVQLVIFLALLLILNKLLFKPFLRYFSERDELVVGMREKAAAIEKSFSEKSARFDEAIRSATSKAAADMERLKVEGQSAARDLISAARQKSTQEIETAVGKVKNEAEAARKDVSRDVNLIATQIAEKVLGRKMA